MLLNSISRYFVLVISLAYVSVLPSFADTATTDSKQLNGNVKKNTNQN